MRARRRGWRLMKLATKRVPELFFPELSAELLVGPAASHDARQVSMITQVLQHGVALCLIVPSVGV